MLEIIAQSSLVGCFFTQYCGQNEWNMLMDDGWSLDDSDGLADDPLSS